MEPEFVVTTNPGDLDVIERSSGLTIRWSGGDPSSTVAILGFSVTATYDGKAFLCSENVSAGQFTIPASVLSQLPASPVISMGGLSPLARGRLSVGAPGKGARFATPTGLDILIANNNWMWTYSPQYK
jgi:hypothetical protein